MIELTEEKHASLRELIERIDQACRKADKVKHKNPPMPEHRAER